MATVVGGIGYGAFTLAKRYVYPIIAPPTPPQLEQDKASIDASFDKAFALLDQLATDTEELKASEKTRTERLDQALSEVEGVVGQMKDATRRRDDEIRRTNDEVRSLRDLIPKAIKTQEENTDVRLVELAKEMQSLKTLIASRVSTAGAPGAKATPPMASAPFEAPTNGTSSNPAYTGAGTGEEKSAEAQNGLSASGAGSARSTSPYSARIANGRAKIPAWQMAASKQAESSAQDTSESGTVADANA